MMDEDERLFVVNGDDYSCPGPSTEVTVVERDVDVAIIGNGPSGIFLSLLLSGYRPYFTGEHSNPFLTHKLLQHPEQSLVDQELGELSEGLEGRSCNQLALLMDTLLLPDADIGESNDSTLCWRVDKTKQVSHVVIGDGAPGGSWQAMQGEVQSLSLGRWLELPDYSFQEWSAHKSEDNESHDISFKRVTLSTVAEYYQDYVVKMGLQSHMINNVRVTKAKMYPPPVRCTVGSPVSPPPVSVMSPCSLDSPSGLPMHTVDSGLILSERDSSCEAKLLDNGLSDYSCSSDSEDDGVCCSVRKSCDYRWCLKGTGRNEAVIVRAKKLVLACGVGGGPRRLGVDGEGASFVCYRFSDFCQKLDAVDDGCFPVVVVGAGLSAADAVLLCLQRGLRVVHVFHQDPRDPALIYTKMPPTVYPEYRRLLELMKEEKQDDLYLPVSQSKVSNFAEGNLVTHVNHNGVNTTLSTSLAGVFIGSEANLSFLPKNVRAQLAVDPSQPINAKTNPVDVDPLSFESESCPSLYALGPLVGDHFVRFVFGSGLGACKHLTNSLDQQ